MQNLHLKLSLCVLNSPFADPYSLSRGTNLQFLINSFWFQVVTAKNQNKFSVIQPHS